MRIRIAHEITHRYAPPARMLVQNLRLTPHGFDSQYVLGWRIGLDIDRILKMSEDAHGNVVGTFSHHGQPIDSLTVTAMGEIETSDSAGVVKGTAERLPTEMYLRDSPLAHTNGALRVFAAEAATGASDRLDALHRLMSAVNEIMTFDPHRTDDPESAAEAFALRRGRARDFAHIFIACARFLGAPARFVNGYRTAEEEGEEIGRPARTAGPKGTLRGWAGSPSTRPPASAPISVMSASPSASTPGTPALSAPLTARGTTRSKA